MAHTSSRYFTRAHLAGSLLLALSACGEPVPPPPPPPQQGSLQLGTVDVRRYGDTRWVDMTDGLEVELAPGAQGGFHVWLLYRVQGLSGSVRVRRIAEKLLPDGSRQRVLTTDGLQTLPEQPTWELPEPIPSFMCPTPIGVSVIDADIELLVRMEAPSAPEPPLAEQRVRVLTRCPPVGDSQRDFCMSICKS